MWPWLSDSGETCRDAWAVTIRRLLGCDPATSDVNCLEHGSSGEVDNRGFTSEFGPRSAETVKNLSPQIRPEIWSADKRPPWISTQTFDSTIVKSMPTAIVPPPYDFVEYEADPDPHQADFDLSLELPVSACRLNGRLVRVERSTKFGSGMRYNHSPRMVVQQPSSRSTTLWVFISTFSGERKGPDKRPLRPFSWDGQSSPAPYRVADWNR